MRKISIVYSTHNEQNNPFLQKSLQEYLSNYSKFIEVIVVDGSSSDNTPRMAHSLGAKVIPSKEPTRAGRLNIGIINSNNNLIVLHHPRSYLQKEAIEFLIHEENPPAWGAFTHVFDFEHSLLDFTSWYSNHIRGDISGIFYLDHCLFFDKRLLSNDQEPIPQSPIFEDTLFCQKLKRFKKPVRLQFRSTTSSIRFKKNGVWRQALLNQVLKVGFHMGIPLEIMNRIYERGLGLNTKY